MCTMPKAFPAEFHRDVVAVARKREARLNQIAKDFGISEATLHDRLKKQDSEESVRGEHNCLRPLFGRGERDLAPGGHLPGAWPQPKMMYPLVTDLADEGIP